jgi:hypothetical protein
MLVVLIGDVCQVIAGNASGDGSHDRELVMNYDVLLSRKSR